MGQEIFFYDMLSNHEQEKDFLGCALSAVKSSSSTKIVLGDEASDIPTISVYTSHILRKLMIITFHLYY